MGREGGSLRWAAEQEGRERVLPFRTGQQQSHLAAFESRQIIHF